VLLKKINTVLLLGVAVSFLWGLYAVFFSPDYLQSRVFLAANGLVLTMYFLLFFLKKSSRRIYFFSSVVAFCAVVLGTLDYIHPALLLATWNYFLALPLIFFFSLIPQQLYRMKNRIAWVASFFTAFTGALLVGILLAKISEETVFLFAEACFFLDLLLVLMVLVLARKAG
jgi:hypothetical protein